MEYLPDVSALPFARKPVSMPRRITASSVSSAAFSSAAVLALSWAAAEASSRSSAVTPASGNSVPPFVVASIRTSPPVVVTTAPATYAATSAFTSLSAMDRPIEIETPAPDPPTDPATEAAPATARIRDESSARISRIDASTVSPAVVAMNALTSVAILFSVNTPAPLRATPAVPPPDSAAAAATTTASMIVLEATVSVSAPAASTLDSRT